MPDQDSPEPQLSLPALVVLLFAYMVFDALFHLVLAVVVILPVLALADLLHWACR